MLEVLILTPFIMWIIFTSVEYWIIGRQIDQVDTIKEHYLNRIRLSGWLSIIDEAALRNKLEDAGFTDIEITATCTADGSSIKESDGASKVLRNDDPDLCEVKLRIRCKPEGKDFYIDKSGVALVEYAG